MDAVGQSIREFEKCIHEYPENMNNSLSPIKSKAMSLIFEANHVTSLSDSMAVVLLVESSQALEKALNESSMDTNIYSQEFSRFMAIGNYALHKCYEKNLILQGHEVKLSLDRLSDHKQVIMVCLVNDRSNAAISSIQEAVKTQIKKELRFLTSNLIDSISVFGLREWLLGKSRIF